MTFEENLVSFKNYNIFKNSNTLIFDDFIKIICDKEIIKCVDNLIRSLEDAINIRGIINGKELISVYTICAYDNVLFGDKKDENINNMISKGREIANIIENNKTYSKESLFNFAQLCIEFKSLFKLWKEDDKNKLINDIHEAYFKLDASISLSKLEGDDYDGWKKGVNNVQTILKDNLELIAGKESIKELENIKYDVMMLDTKVQNGIALVMEKAFWDHIITEMNIGNYKSFLGLFSEIKELLNILVSGNQLFMNVIDNGIKTKIEKCDIQIIYNNIVFIYEKIKEYGIPANDNYMDELLEKIHNDFSNIKKLDKNKTLLEYIKVAFDLIKDLIQKKDAFFEKTLKDCKK